VRALAYPYVAETANIANIANSPVKALLMPCGGAASTAYEAERIANNPPQNREHLLRVRDSPCGYSRSHGGNQRQLPVLTCTVRDVRDVRGFARISPS
jgi:hypothetical protein